VDRLERFPHVVRIEPDQRILSDFGATDGFDLDLIDCPLGALLGEAGMAEREQEREAQERAKVRSTKGKTSTGQICHGINSFPL
jgi:hypothetical protein